MSEREIDTLTEIHRVIDEDNLLVQRNDYGSRREWVVFKRGRSGNCISPFFAGATLPDAVRSYLEKEK